MSIHGLKVSLVDHSLEAFKKVISTTFIQPTIKANSARGNFPFAEVNGVPVSWNCEISRVGTPLQIRRRSEHFEPPAEHKGNVARAIFYFSVRYKMKVTPGQEAFLKEWHLKMTL